MNIIKIKELKDQKYDENYVAIDGKDMVIEIDDLGEEIYWI